MISVSAGKAGISPAVCSLWRTGKNSSSKACVPSAPYAKTPILAKCLWAANLCALWDSTTMLGELIRLLQYRFEQIDFIDEPVDLGFDCRSCTFFA